MTTGSANTALTRWPTRAESDSTSSGDGGSPKATANTLPSRRRGMAPYSRATSSGMTTEASGLGDIADRSMAGI
ncbi:MAG: hypothetical protein ABSF33_13380 [Acidimicrobiales bacterium]